MPGHIQDCWYKTGPDGSCQTAQSEVSCSLTSRSARQKTWLAQVEADLSRGQYTDPSAAKVTFKQYAIEWLKSQTINASSVEATELRLRLHAFPHIGYRPLNAFQPVHMRQWARALQDSGLAGSYQRVIFANASAVFSRPPSMMA